MTLISYSKITDGSTVDASDVNTPLDTIYNDHNGGIDSTNLADNAVTTAKITNANVTTAKLADASVTRAKLSTTAGELGGAWQSWTPTLTNLTLGNGTVDAKYFQIGKTILFRFRFTLGSTSAVGTGPNFTLPVSAISSKYGMTSSGAPEIGHGHIEDNGTNGYSCKLLLPSATTATVVINNVAATYPTYAQVTATVPFTFTTGDELMLVGEYEAA